MKKRKKKTGNCAVIKPHLAKKATDLILYYGINEFLIDQITYSIEVLFKYNNSFFWEKGWVRGQFLQNGYILRVQESGEMPAFQGRNRLFSDEQIHRNQGKNRLFSNEQIHRKNLIYALG